MEDFDVDKFINLIKSKESIWNYKSPVYGDKIQRRNDWICVFREFVPNIENKSKEELHDIAKEFQGRWRVLRDGFTRSLRKQIRRSISGSTSITSRLYTYHAQLLFLKDLYDDKPMKSKETNSLTTDEEDIVSYSVGEIKRPQKRTHIETSPEDVLIEKLTKRLKEDIGGDNRVEEDDDKQFLMCILKDFKKIPDDHKLDAKSDILNIIRHYKNINSNQAQDKFSTLNIDHLRENNEARQGLVTDRVQVANYSTVNSDSSRHEQSQDEMLVCLSPETLTKTMVKYEE